MTATGKRLFEISVEVTMYGLVELSEGLRQGFDLLEESERDEVVKGFATACDLAAAASRLALSTGGLTKAEELDLVNAEIDKILARN